jgi:hypothetical protein
MPAEACQPIPTEEDGPIEHKKQASYGQSRVREIARRQGIKELYIAYKILKVLDDVKPGMTAN